MPNRELRNLAGEFSTWLAKSCVGGTLPDECFDDLIRRVGTLLWTSFSQDEKSAMKSPGIQEILGVLHVPADYYLEKFKIWQGTSATEGCKYWPPVPGWLLRSEPQITRLDRALKIIGEEQERARLSK